MTSGKVSLGLFLPGAIKTELSDSRHPHASRLLRADLILYHTLDISSSTHLFETMSQVPTPPASRHASASPDAELKPAPTPDSTALMQSLDDLLERYLHLLDQHQKLQSAMASHLSAVCRSPHITRICIPKLTAQGIHVAGARQLHLSSRAAVRRRLLR